ncbi:DNA polymerase I [candidate division WS5 bacterium]|uniref:DNA polymerase I n=1 Tax=candidate division WS5 bacterium TaxID=2093353 RepID=A0A419DEJ6_9BACT|nr:MAG: DNA polymerase I [candidate division WS5 bacterium]
MKKQKFVVFDGNAVVHRAYHAMPPMTTKKGELVNAVYGYSSMMLKVLAELKPDYVAVAFDMQAPTFRHEEYKEYKATRVKGPEDLYEQFLRVREVTEALNIPIFEKKGFEADDIIGTLACVAPKGIEVIIVTGDLDELQLVDKRTKVYTMRRGFTDTVLYDEKAVLDRYGFGPDKLVDYKALRGDPSDNIPGVAGIGEKSAMSLIQKYGSVENIYKNIDDLTGSLKNKLEAGRENALLSKRLSQIVCDVSVKLNLDKCCTYDFDRQKVFKVFQELGFKSLLNRLPKEELQQGLFAEGSNSAKTALAKEDKIHIKKADYKIITEEKDLDKLTKSFAKEKIIAVDTETDSQIAVSANLVGISISKKEGEAYYIPVGHEVKSEKLKVKSDGFRTSQNDETNLDSRQLPKELVLEKLRPILENKRVKKVGHNLKYDYIVFKNAGITLNGIYFDTMIVAYLLNQNLRSPKLDDVAFSEIGIEMIHIHEIIGKGKNEINFKDAEIEKAYKYACEDADVALRLYHHLREELAEKKQKGLYERIEAPLIPILAEMEIAGVLVDEKVLEKSSREMGSRTKKLEKEIHKMGGDVFNINSPSQLQKILFEKLRLQEKIDDPRELKKLKSGGFSTGAGELEKLSGTHKIIGKISEYRELTKLKSTYLDTLPNLINPRTGRIHTSFNQAITATGRLSSSDPNLQNIPIRTEEGKEIRKAFIAPKGKKLLCVDYSQIELRIVAHISGDKVMTETFRRADRDIHTATAAKVYGVKESEVTANMRRNAKAVNFGIIYGVSPHGLKQSTGMSREEAHDFIEKYFKVHTGIKKYTKEIIEVAKKVGYVDTLFDRRRYLPEINSNNFAVRGQAERMALNMPIQGTAADLIKMAMIEIAKDLPKISPDTQMLLQVHDELVFEVPDKDIKKVTKFVTDKMDNVIKLSVPITAVAESGQNWAECK